MRITRDPSPVPAAENSENIRLGISHFPRRGVLCQLRPTSRFADMPHYPGAARRRHTANGASIQRTVVIRRTKVMLRCGQDLALIKRGDHSGRGGRPIPLCVKKV